VRTHLTGLLIIRAWLEDGSVEPLRAHLRIADDISNGIERSSTLVNADEVGRLVEAWLVGIVEDGARAPGTDDR
jgi:hypothetical protein